MGLRDRLFNVMVKRPPDFVIGGVENPYLLRWWLTPWSGLYRDIPEEKRTRWQRFVRALPNAYLHIFLRSDDDRALHDHPWLCNASFLLDGSYTEYVPGWKVRRHAGQGKTRWERDPQNPIAILRDAGSWYFRWGRAIHRVHLHAGPCTTLFITGFAVREWGFWCPKGWVHFKRFTETRDGVSTVGRGCE